MQLEHPTSFATAFDAVQVHIDRRFQNPFYELTEKLFGNATFEGPIKTLTREAEAIINSGTCGHVGRCRGPADDPS